ncbi:hypothetical protein QR680_016661 [Steinernema hermaphroditum]|uniref:Protein kinase domain-containing protein n=1 Tax=Steinernema hermaphroditum TaxID=289476 RepID=A0AA39HBX7_9BILA|nr:hypothetical protein QR680_016661 [Steinernema hermaphroditum]
MAKRPVGSKGATVDAKKKIPSAPVKKDKGKVGKAAQKNSQDKAAQKDEAPNQSAKTVQDDKSKMAKDAPSKEKSIREARVKEKTTTTKQPSPKEKPSKESPSTEESNQDSTSKSLMSKRKAKGEISKKPLADVADDPTLCINDGDTEDPPIATVHLHTGDVVTITDKEFHVDKMLTTGLVGQIYVVTQTSLKGRKQYALKSEDISYRGKRLRNETSFLKALMEVGKPSQLPMLCSNGRNELCRFIVTDLYGDNLRDLHQKNRFSLATSLRVAFHTLEAICELHTIAHYVHRCLAPSNFCASTRDATSPSVALVNFAMAKKFRGEDKSKGKTRCRFFGNVRYASRNAHLMKDRGRKDDLESWLYMVLDFCDDNALPWNHYSDKTEVYYGKVNLFDDPTAHLKILEHATQWSGVAATINKMDENEAPDYRYFRKRLDEASSKSKINLNGAIQWSEKRK